MSNKNLFTVATLIGCAVVVLAHAATADAAASKKAKPSAPKTVASKVMMCEGVTSRVSSNSMTGDVRNDAPLTFSMTINRAQATATIMGVRGSTVLKAGRHVVQREAGSDIIDINWTDYDSSPQILRLVIDKSGEFKARSGDSRVTNPAQQMVCGLLGGYCEVASVTSHVEMSGVCWDSN